MDSFDVFDQFLKSRERQTVTEEVVENDDSSSSYYEEEIIEDDVVRTDLRLSTVHENDDVSSDNDDEDMSETEVFWEDVSESFKTDNVDDGDESGEIDTNSDMLARVRTIMDENNNQGEGSLVDSSSVNSSASEGGSSSVLPMDFDLGSYDDADLHTSDEETEDPEYYEEACREMIATVHPHLDPNTMLHGCDLQNLYINLKQQYRHILRNSSVAGKIDKSSISGLSSSGDAAGVVDDSDGNHFTELSFKSDSDSNADVLSPHIIPNDVGLEDTTKIDPVALSNNVSEIDISSGSRNVDTPPRTPRRNPSPSRTPPRKIEKWIERDADDPEDYEEACRFLCQLMYDENDPDYDVENMLRRSSPKNLYNYLKPHYWYLVHTNQLDEYGVYKDKYTQNVVEEDAQEIEPGDSGKRLSESTTTSNVESLRSLFSNRAASEGSKTMKASDKRLDGSTSAVNVESLKSALLNRIETPEQSKKRKAEISSEMKEIHEEDESLEHDHPSVKQKTESNEDDGEASQNEKSEREIQGWEDEFELPIIEEPSEGSRRADNTGESAEEIDVQNGATNGAVSSSTTVSEHEKAVSVDNDASLNEKSNETESLDRSKSFEDAIDSTKCAGGGSTGEHESNDEKTSSIKRNNSGQSLKLSQYIESDFRMSHDDGIKLKTTVKDPKELEWRKMKIQEDLRSIMEETEVTELREPISSEIVAALIAGSLKTAFTKKYYHKIRHDYVYYPSVAKAVKDFSVIEEAEKIFGEEFSFELSTALCTVAASRIKGDITEVDENDAAVREATVFVVFDDGVLSENEVRKKRIKNDLVSIIKDAEKNGIGGNIEYEAIDALVKAANEIVFIKKYYDVTTDVFKYFPSVKKTILNNSLTERAQDFYFNGVHDFPLDYISAIRASAAKLHEDYEVDELDDYVVNMAVDVDTYDEFQSEKCRDFSMTLDTASMISSQIDGSSLTTEALANVNGEGDQDTDCRDKESEAGVAKDFVEMRTNSRKNNRLQNALPVLEDTSDTESRQTNGKNSNALEDIKLMDITKLTEDLNQETFDQRFAEASLDEKESLLTARYLHDKRKIDEALADLESEFASELNRLDNEATACSLKHKIEAERIEKDRKGVEEESLADDNKMKEQTKELLAKLSTAVRVLQEERNRTDSESEVEEEMEKEKDDNTKWGWMFTGKSFTDRSRSKSKSNLEKEKQKQTKLMKTKIREIELEKDIDDIKAQLAFVKQQARAKKRNIKEWRTELDEEYRRLEELTSATEEKLKEEMRNLHTSYGEERQSLLKERSDLEEIRKEDLEWIASEKKKDGQDIATKAYSLEMPKDDMVHEAINKISLEGDGPIDSNVMENAEDAGEGEEYDLILTNHTGMRDDDNSVASGDYVIPGHLAHLNQPRELNDDVSLGSFDIFDSPEEEDNVSNKKLLAAALKGKEESDARLSANERKGKLDEVATPDRPKQIQDEFPPRPPGKLDLSKGNELSNKKFLTAPLNVGKKEPRGALTTETETKTIHNTEESTDRVTRSPGKSLSEMRRKVEEALEKAIAIRNGDSSSRHSRSISVEKQIVRGVENMSVGDSPSRDIDRFLSAPSLSPSRHSANPIYPMIRETDRLSGFIRRYEKKLETVCKSLLTLASVTGDEQEVLAARQLELPEMLEYVVQQDWYKAHSTDSKSAGTPHFVFAKSKNGKEGDSGSDSGYSITATGKSFLEVDGPVPSDVSRFLKYLSRIDEGLTRDAMLKQWEEIAELSGDEQSRRVCEKLDKLISFCLDSNMIKK